MYTYMECANCGTQKETETTEVVSVPLNGFLFTIFYEKAATFKANQISFIGMGHTKGLPLTEPENNTDL